MAALARWGVPLKLGDDLRRLGARVSTLGRLHLKRGGQLLSSGGSRRQIRQTQLAVRSSAKSSSFVELVKEKNGQSPVVVYSKTYCPYCSQVKGLFKTLGVDAKVIELDEFQDGAEIQEALLELTGQRTVPNVFIGGQHIGGCDDTLELHRADKLLGLLQAAEAQ